MSARKFKIVTDTGCDMTNEWLEKRDVHVIKLGFYMNDTEYEGESNNHMTPEEFYVQLKAGAMPVTSQINPDVATKHMEALVKEGNDVLAVVFSSGLSGTANSFELAAKEINGKYPKQKVVIVDSLSASMGQGLLLDYVIKKADQGASIEETAQYANQIKWSINHQFTVNDLFHLKRGGRLSAASAVLGTIINIKPMLRFSNEGKLCVANKIIGRRKALNTLVEKFKATHTLEEGDPVFISHSESLQDALYLKGEIEKLVNNPITINYIGPVIGAHTGCDTIALFYKGIDRDAK
ncbi:MAG: DegV family protein [Clostridia bacterium]|nr:DegV family protein [Clostridia bacterium]